MKLITPYMSNNKQRSSKQINLTENFPIHLLKSVNQTHSSTDHLSVEALPS